MNVTWKPLSSDRYADAARLLDDNHLPTADLRPDRVWLLGAFSDRHSLLGTAGLEVVTPMLALVRSMAVTAESRGHRLGDELHRRVLEEARRRGVASVFTLTQTAEPFFLRRGYRRVERADVPAAIRATAQFSDLCPSSTAVLTLDLGPALQ